jgi:hypothetical protein
MAALALALASNAAHAVAIKAKAVDILPIIAIFELTYSQKIAVNIPMNIKNNIGMLISLVILSKSESYLTEYKFSAIFMSYVFTIQKMH